MPHVQSKACCNTPAVVGKYEAKGKYATVNGMKTYITGPSDAKKAILIVYDIFGFFPQSIQGADILASGDSENPYQVFMPDFFDGEPADISWYPPGDDEEKGKKLGQFFQTKAAPPKTIERIPACVKEFEKMNSNISSWGIIGFCWGGKIANLVSQKGSLFKSAAACHPAMIDPKDAAAITIPILIVPSQGEDKKDVEAYEKALSVKYAIEPFYDDLHGFMAARATLSNPKEKSSYERGYKCVLDWFNETL